MLLTAQLSPVRPGIQIQGGFTSVGAVPALGWALMTADQNPTAGAKKALQAQNEPTSVEPVAVEPVVDVRHRVACRAGHAFRGGGDAVPGPALQRSTAHDAKPR